MRRLILAALLLSAPALADPPAGADPNSPTAQWFKGLHMPQSRISCCDVSDCRPVRAWMEDGRWVAERADGMLVDVPPGSVLHNEMHPGGAAILCEDGGSVFCFVPPQAGG